MNEFKLTEECIPGAIGRITELHATYYSKNWGFGSLFEAKVSSELSEFICNYNDNQDRIFLLSINEKIEASIIVDRSSEKENIAHLRWFIVSNKLKGKGAGNFLMQEAMKFCKENSYDKIYLWTFKGLNTAKHLYGKYGFKLVNERLGKQWSALVTEQRFNANLRLHKKT